MGSLLSRPKTTGRYISDMEWLRAWAPPLYEGRYTHQINAQINAARATIPTCRVIFESRHFTLGTHVRLFYGPDLYLYYYAPPGSALYKRYIADPIWRIPPRPTPPLAFGPVVLLL